MDINKQVEEKVRDLVYYRVYYQVAYENQLEQKKKIHIKYHLALPSGEVVEVAKYLLNWALGGVAWDVVTAGIKRLRQRLSKNRKRALSNEFLSLTSNDELLKKFADQLKAGLKSPDKLDPLVRAAIAEEAMVNYIVEKTSKILIGDPRDQKNCVKVLSLPIGKAKTGTK